MSSRKALPVSVALTAACRSASLYGTVKRIIFIDSRNRAKCSSRRKQ